MPERPDLAYIIGILEETLTNATFASVRVTKPVVLRTMVRGDPNDLLAGQRITEISRKGHFVNFALEGRPRLTMAIHLMLSGRFRIKDQAAAGGTPRALAMAFILEDGREVQLLDDHQMAKVYLFDPPDEAQVPQLGNVGVDVLADEFTFAVFKAIARKRRDQVKVFLLDKSALDSFGNAYADETLHEARLHPKAWVKKLSEAELRQLYTAMRTVLPRATTTVADRKPALDEKIRDFLKVRNRKGQPCPDCGDKVRVCGVRGHDAFFCPTCQPDGRGTGLVSWR